MRFERAAAAHMWLSTILLSPVMLLHELGHVLAAWAFDVQLYELAVILDERGGVSCWLVYHDNVDGVVDHAIALAPLVFMPVGYLLAQTHPVAGAVVFLAGLGGIGDVAHTLYRLDLFEAELFDELDDAFDDRVTLWTFNEPPALQEGPA